MPSYTVIVEHAGGTYVSQIRADNRDAAIRSWLDDRTPGSSSAPYIHGNKSKARNALEKQLTDSDFGPSRLDGCINVWQCLFKVRQKDGSFHIIRTDEEAEKSIVGSSGLRP